MHIQIIVDNSRSRRARNRRFDRSNRKSLTTARRKSVKYQAKPWKHPDLDGRVNKGLRDAIRTEYRRRKKYGIEMDKYQPRDVVHTWKDDASIVDHDGFDVATTVIGDVDLDDEFAELEQELKELNWGGGNVDN